MEHSQKGYEKPELFFGLVGPLGADLDSLTRFLENSLCDVGYDVKMLRLSDLLRYIWKKPLPKRSGPLDKYIKSLQDAGDEFRKKIFPFFLKRTFPVKCGNIPDNPH